MRFAVTAQVPLVSKIVPGAGSVGVQLIKSNRECVKIVRHAFSRSGRATHMPYLRQKDYVYFQQFIASDGYDLRVIIVDDKAFRVFPTDARRMTFASGMGLVEKRQLPKAAIDLARRTHARTAVADARRGHASRYGGTIWITELSPICQVDTAEQLHVDGVPRAYHAEDDNRSFYPGRYWVHELAFRAIIPEMSQPT